MSNNSQKTTAPSHFCCPITLALMEDPVIASDGNSYDREALRVWAASERAAGREPRLPASNILFDESQLVPNRALKDAIDQWRVNNNDGDAAVGPLSTVAAAPPPPPLPLPAAAPRDSTPIVPTRYYANAAKDAIVAIAPSNGPRRRLHVVVVVDVSGSMASLATMRDETGAKAEFDNTVLDLVLYASKAVANMLAPGDAFTLVKFTTSATVVLSNVEVKTTADIGKDGAVMKRITSALATLTPDASTNLGDALRCALEAVVSNYSNDPDRLNCVMMLTDGQPNTGPVALDVLGAFRRRTDPIALSGDVNKTREGNHSSIQCVGDIISYRTIINTFAFGYSDGSADNLASSLMYDVAALGNGTFGYIPDISFLGTQFIHCLANMRVVASVTADAIQDNILPHTLGLWSVQYGQIGFSCRQTDWSAALPTIDFSTPLSGEPIAATETEMAAVRSALPSVLTTFGVARDLSVCLRGWCGPFDCKYDVHGRRFDSGANRVGEVSCKEALQRLTDAAGGGEANHEGLADDIKDQLSIAFRPDFYNRWGRHYMYSWLSATQHRVCTNFKDRSLGAYKTKVMSAVHDAYDDIFNLMPPPEPRPVPQSSPFGQQRSSVSMSSRNCSAFGGAAAAAAPNVFSSAPCATRSIQSTRLINSSANPCVHEDSTVTMGDGSVKAVRSLRHGDTVRLADGSNGTVGHIIKTRCEKETAQLIQFPSVDGVRNGLRITPWHPVMVSNTPSQRARSDYVDDTPQWLLPVHTGYDAVYCPCSHVYSFTVTTADGNINKDSNDKNNMPSPAMLIDGISVVYLGHGYTKPMSLPPDAAALAHPFFGSPNVLAQLEAAYPSQWHHVLEPEPLIKGSTAGGDVIAIGWDISKRVGSW